MEEKSIDVYAAVAQMRAISAEGGVFSLKFRKWNRQTGKGGDLVHVPAARLRPKASDEVVANSDFKLFFTDTSTGQALNCWTSLVVEFNGMKTLLN